MTKDEKTELRNAKMKARNMAHLDRQAKRDLKNASMDISDHRSPKQDQYLDDEHMLHPVNLYRWMEKNIKYSHPSNWTLQSAEKTLETKRGDCHDQTLFEYKAFKKFWGNKYHPICFFIINKDGSHTHSFLVYQDRGKYHWFEHAWAKHKGILYVDKSLKAIKDSVLANFCEEYGGDPKDTYIGRWKTYQTGLDIKSFCMLQVGK